MIFVKIGAEQVLVDAIRELIRSLREEDSGIAARVWGEETSNLVEVQA